MHSLFFRIICSNDVKMRPVGWHISSFGCFKIYLSIYLFVEDIEVDAKEGEETTTDTNRRRLRCWMGGIF